MSGKMYLNRVRTMCIVINSRLRQLEELNEMKTAIGSPSRTGDPVQTSKSGEAPYARTVEKIAELEQEISRMVADYGRVKSRIISEIGELENPVYVDLLMRRYVQYERFEQIAYEMSYSYDHARRLHGMALKAFEEMHPERCNGAGQ